LNPTSVRLRKRFQCGYLSTIGVCAERSEIALFIRYLGKFVGRLRQIWDSRREYHLRGPSTCPIAFAMGARLTRALEGRRVAAIVTLHFKSIFSAHCWLGYRNRRQLRAAHIKRIFYEEKTWT
jgi:hypothetical protein